MAQFSFTVADIGFLLLYPLVIAAFVIQMRRLGKTKLAPWWLIALLTAFAGVMLFLTWGTFVQAYTDKDMPWFISQILYFVGDVTIVIGCALIAWHTRGGIISVAWSILLASFTVFAFGNQFYNYFNTLLGENYKTGNCVSCLSWFVR